MQSSATLPAPARLALVLVLAVLTLGVHGTGLFGEFLYDDGRLIAANPNVRSVGAALAAWWEPLWSFENPGQSEQAGYWRPLTVLAIAVGRWIGGGEPAGIHGLSILLHLGASLAAASVARRVLRHDLLGWAAGVLFALHPAHVQSVAWASAINDPLYGLFALLSLGAFLRWRDAGGEGVPVLAGLWLGLGLLAKEQALVVLPMALVLEACLPSPGDGSGRARGALLGRAAAGLGAVLGLWLIARMVVFGGLAEGFRGSITEFGLSAGRMALLGLEIAGDFVRIVLAPGELAFFRGVQPDLGWTDAGALVPLAWLGAVVLAGALAVRAGWWRLAASLGLLIVPLLPHAAAPEAAGAYPVADRFVYLAVLGGALAMAEVVRRLPAGAGVALLAMAAAFFGQRSLERTGMYADEETFFRTAVQESPEVPVVHWSLGRVLVERYKRDREKEDLDEALYSYLRCLMLGHDYGARGPKLGADAPLMDRLRELQAVVHGYQGKPPIDNSVMVSVDDRVQANLGQGWCLLFAGQLPPEFDLDAPLQVFRQITDAFPQDSRAATGLGTTHLVRGELELAKAELSRAIEINMANADAWSNLGQTLSKMGDFDGARGAFQESLVYRPGSIRDRVRLVEACIDGGRVKQAGQAIEDLRSVAGDLPQVDYLEGMLAANQGRWEEALLKFDTVVAADPGDGVNHLQRGKVLTQMNRVPESVEAFGRAAELLPTSFEAHYNLAALLAGNPATQAGSQPYLERAYQLGTPGKQRMILQEELASRLPEDADAIWPYLIFDQRRGDAIATLGWVERIFNLENPWGAKPDREARLASVHLAAANALDQLGETERALVEFQNSVLKDSEQFWAWHNLAIAYSKLGRHAEAVTASGEALDRIEQVDERMRSAVLEAMNKLAERNQTQLETFVGPTLETPDRKDVPSAKRDQE